MSDASNDCSACAIPIPQIQIGYVQEFDPDEHRRVRTRFARDIEALAALGFRELGFYREQFGLFSTIIGVPMWLLMLWKREVMRLDRRLQISAAFILMYHNDPTTVCVPLALGVKMYTGFTDRTLLISTNFPSCAVSNRPGSVLKFSSKAAIADAWASHQQHVRTLQAQGKEIHRSVGFDYYVEVSRQEELALS